MKLKQRHSGRLQGGFSLLEMALAMMVLGIIIGPLFTLAEKQIENKEEQYQAAVERRVVDALALYVKENGLYPCPADPTLAVGDANFGRSQPAAGGAFAPPPTPPYPPGTPRCQNTVFINGGGPPPGNRAHLGDLPVYDLGLPFQMAANSNGWKYKYAVSNTLIFPDDLGEGYIILETEPDPIGDVIYSSAPFVIINPGENGVGAMGLSGAAGPPCAGGWEADNCDNDLTFVDAPYSTAPANYYDDAIFYTPPYEKEGMWLLAEDMTGGIKNIMNRNVGYVGLDTNPSDLLHSSGGNFLIQYSSVSGQGGILFVSTDMDAEQNIRAENIMRAQQRTISPQFIYK